MLVYSSASRLDLTVRLYWYSTTVNFQYRVFPASEARVLSEAFCISQNIHVGLVRTACSFRCAFLNSPSSLVTNACFGEGCHYRPLVPATCSDTFFPRDASTTCKGYRLY